VKRIGPDFWLRSSSEIALAFNRQPVPNISCSSSERRAKLPDRPDHGYPPKVNGLFFVKKTRDMATKELLNGFGDQLERQRIAGIAGNQRFSQCSSEPTSLALLSAFLVRPTGWRPVRGERAHRPVFSPAKKLNLFGLFPGWSGAENSCAETSPTRRNTTGHKPRRWSRY